MKTEFEISSAISNYITSDEGVTDFPVTLKQISDEVDTLRVRMMEEADSKGIFKRPFYNWTQTILYGGGTGQPPVLLDSSTRVRYVEVPRIFFLSSQKPAIAYVGAYDGSQAFRIVSGQQRQWFKSDRWIGRLPTAVVMEATDNDGYRIEFHNISPNRFRLTSVFEDPSDMEPLNGYNGDATIQQGGTLYPMPSGQVDVAIGKTVESYLRTLYRHPIQGNQAVDAPMQSKENQPV